MHSLDESTESKNKKYINELSPNSKNNDDTQISTDEISPIKPIAINPKKLLTINNETSTWYSSSKTLSSLNSDQEIPIIYPQFQLRCIRDAKNPNLVDFTNYSENNENLDKKSKYFYYNIQNLNYINLKNEFLSNNFNNKGHDSKQKLCCSCTKTKCIKKYCKCFANKKLCSNCQCQNCINNIYRFNNKRMQKKWIKTENIICTCSKSGCNKKYCECYKAGVFCNNKCRCINCMNDKKTNLDKNETINLDEKEFLSRKNSPNNNNICNSKENFKVERISVFINKNQTYINVEKFGTEDFKYLGKKTYKQKNKKTINKKK